MNLYEKIVNREEKIALVGLGYDPEYSFEDGIKLAIEWYKENL